MSSGLASQYARQRLGVVEGGLGAAEVTYTREICHSPRARFAPVPTAAQ